MTKKFICMAISVFMVMNFFSVIVFASPIPTVSKVAITGSIEQGETITGIYRWDSTNSGVEGASAYRWLISSTQTGTYTAIIDATSKTYTIATTDFSKWIKFEVTPVLQDGTAGVATLSSPVQVPASMLAVTRIGSPLTGSQTATPPENCFTVDGRSFILMGPAMNPASNPESKFFILAKEDYGRKAYDPDNTIKFDLTDSNNLAYFLNDFTSDTGFIKYGSGTTYGTVRYLPTGIVQHIDRNHIWRTEAGCSGSNVTGSYNVKCGIVVLSQQEFKDYITKFGIVDGMSQTNVSGWWLRTNRGVSGGPTYLLYACLSTSSNNIGGTQMNQANGSGLFSYIRPAFHLERDFFKSVRIDLSNVGANVVQAIKDNYSWYELANIYTEAEILNTFGMAKPTYEITKCDFTAIGGQPLLYNTLDYTDSVAVNAEITNNYHNNTSATLVLALYDKDNQLLDVVTQPSNITSADTKVTISQQLNFRSGTDPAKAVAYFWDSINGMTPLTKQITFPGE